MLGLYVTVPVACFRKGLAREYLETEALPPPATCYGFLLSLVGETDRNRHIWCRVTSVLIGVPEKSVVLRTVWKIKNRHLLMGQTPPPGAPKKVKSGGGNRMLDKQELLTGVKLVLWLDSIEEKGENPSLEQRVSEALVHPEQIDRFGGLSLGESTHLVDEVKRFDGDAECSGAIFLLADRGRITLPVWVDHIGSERTRYVTGELSLLPLLPPDRQRLPKIEPPEPIASPTSSRRRKSLP
jgi:CRISPR-associated protein Cas5t